MNEKLLKKIIMEELKNILKETAPRRVQRPTNLTRVGNAIADQIDVLYEAATQLNKAIPQQSQQIQTLLQTLLDVATGIENKLGYLTTATTAPVQQTPTRP